MILRFLTPFSRSYFCPIDPLYYMSFCESLLQPRRSLVVDRAKNTNSLTHSLTHSPTHSLTHSLTHLLTHSPTLRFCGNKIQDSNNGRGLLSLSYLCVRKWRSAGTCNSTSVSPWSQRHCCGRRRAWTDVSPCTRCSGWCPRTLPVCTRVRSSSAAGTEAPGRS